jgi:hypothetical protein
LKQCPFAHFVILIDRVYLDCHQVNAKERTSMATPDNPDTLLRRKAVAEALTAAGYPVTESTLATKATRGGGPSFRLFGRVPLYRWGDALAWAEGKMSAPRHSTSEGDVQRDAA